METSPNPELKPASFFRRSGVALVSAVKTAASFLYRCRRRIVRGTLAFVGVVLLVLAAGICYLRHDIDPPDVADLLAAPKLNMESDDFWEVSREIRAKLSEKEWEAVGALLDKWNGEKVWEKEAAEKLLNKAEQAGVWPLIEKAIRADRGPTGWGMDFVDGGFNMYDCFSPMKLMRIRIEDFVRRGQPDLALAESIKIFALGQSCLRTSSNMIRFLVGDVVQENVIIDLRKLVKEYTFSENAMRRAILELEHSHISQQTIMNTFRGEFTIAYQFVETNRYDDPGFKMINMGFPDWIIKITFRKNETIKIWADHYRELLTIPLNKDSMKKANKLSDKMIDGYLRRNYISNLGGRKIMSHYMMNSASVFMRHAQTRSGISAARAALGVRLYQAKHAGAFPDSLDELVREGILASVPLDYMDDQPIRYSRELRAVWSVGEKGQTPSATPPPERKNWSWATEEERDAMDLERGVFRLL